MACTHLEVPSGLENTSGGGLGPNCAPGQHQDIPVHTNQVGGVSGGSFVCM